MKVFKFGGASVKDAESVKNVGEILDRFQEEKILVVVSAMGKTTNALEEIVKAKFYDKPELNSLIDALKKYHFQIAEQLFVEKSHPCFFDLDEMFEDLNRALEQPTHNEYDYFYDQIVGFGELLSTRIVEHFLRSNAKKSTWQDVRNFIRTDSHFRDASVDWQQTLFQIESLVFPLFQKFDLVITQGFIGESEDALTTTLGREGSDFTGAIFAHALNADSLTIWKDVPGLLNADPKFFDNTIKLDSISYAETIELSYYGASIIHPKTIKPLQNKKIPLFVKSFLQPESEGSVIQMDKNKDGLIPSYIFKKNQVLISISARDFSFIAERNLAIIFSKFAEYNMKVNLMQNSAISFSVCVDHDEDRIARFILDLQDDYKIRYNEGLELITIRHYNDEILDKVIGGKEILLEQKSRVTVQMVVR